MKKKTAITLGALALLAGGITIGGFKIKEKKEKDKIERTLNNVLIPNAESELNDLLSEDADLSDSIAYYQQSLLQQSSEADGQRISEKHNNILGMNNPNMYRKIDDLSKDLKKMQKDYLREFNKVVAKWSKYYQGIDYDYQGYDYESVPQSVKDRTTYLKYGMIKGLYKVDTFNIPGVYKQYYASGRYNDVILFDDLDDYQDGCEYGPLGYDLYNILHDLGYALDATDGSFTTTGMNGNRVFYAMTSTQDIKEVLIAVNTVLDNIDNSQNIINPQTLKDAKSLTKELLRTVEKQIKLEQQRDKSAKKLNGFKTAKKQVEGRIKAKQQELKNYKSPNAVKYIYKQQRYQK